MTDQLLRIVLVSPFHGRSSHAAWAEGWQRHSRHRITIVDLPDQAWAWRLKGGCVPLAQKLGQLDFQPDLVVTTSLACLSSLFGLLRRSKLAGVPLVYYMHENQLTYPIRQGAKRDAQLVLRQFHSQLTADAVWFNSAFNRDSWFSQLPKFMKRFWDFRGMEHLPELQAKSRVLPVGLELPAEPVPPAVNVQPLWLWNQRWEWDKGTDLFVKLLSLLRSERAFEMVLLGETAMGEDDLRLQAREILGGRLAHEGWCPRQEYDEWLARSDFTVSTSRHEFFGISVLESAARGLFTLAPRELSYPEVLPPSLHAHCLYRSMRDLVEKTSLYLDNPQAYLEVRKELQQAAYRYRWQSIVELYDEEATQTARAAL